MIGLKEVFSLGIDKALDATKGLLTTVVKDKGLQQQIDSELAKLQIDLKAKEMDFEARLIDAEVSDKASARLMNTEAFKSSDKLIARFPVILGILAVVVSVGMLILPIFVAIPDNYRDMYNTGLGLFIGSGFGQVYNFYFGSSFKK